MENDTSYSRNVVLFWFIFVSLILFACSVQSTNEYFHINKLIRIGKNGILSNAVVNDKYIQWNGKWFNYYMITYTYVAGDYIKIISKDRISKDKYFNTHSYSTIAITYNNNNNNESYAGDIRNITIKSILFYNLFYYIMLFITLILSLIAESFMTFELLKVIKIKEAT